MPWAGPCSAHEGCGCGTPPGIYKTTSLTFDETEAEDTSQDRGQGSLTIYPSAETLSYFYFKVHSECTPLPGAPLPGSSQTPSCTTWKLHPPSLSSQSSHQRVPVSTRVRPHPGLAAASVHSPPGSHLPGIRAQVHVAHRALHDLSCPLPLSLSPSFILPSWASLLLEAPACQVQSCPRAFARAILPTRNLTFPRPLQGFAPLLQPIPGLDMPLQLSCFPDHLTQDCPPNSRPLSPPSGFLCLPALGPTLVPVCHLSISPVTGHPGLPCPCRAVWSAQGSRPQRGSEADVTVGSLPCCPGGCYP